MELHRTTELQQRNFQLNKRSGFTNVQKKNEKD